MKVPWGRSVPAFKVVSPSGYYHALAAITLHRNNLRRNSPCSATLWMSCYAFKVASFLMSSFLDPRNYYWRHQCCRDPGTSAAMIIVSLSSLQPGSWITLSLNYNILILRSSRLLRSRNLAAINLCKFTAKFLDPGIFFLILTRIFHSMGNKY